MGSEGNPNLVTTSVSISKDENSPLVLTPISADFSANCNTDGLPVKLSIASVGGDIDGVQIRTFDYCLPRTHEDDPESLFTGLEDLNSVVYDQVGVTDITDSAERLCLDPSIIDGKYDDEQ
ncbi:hypothetical protein COW94_04810 [Candidatus Peregrinibacteria bacterium CG22_combo_CG10-13_8_21_14_all_44_10]|nr:MAG: hypothetical protein AUK45_01005 [Candidatus Peregrinibacteria bacterium CG2_30_44_17]PIP65854.1 MAG: hypothetical protein COW94_04810 [Candidatus Peregrinibacteria bacterium CG22_combo_CG10-13_8_21_14_all_44_10]PIS03596.1 MAG: hypothetical protein COT83_05280 [Candidatus Peregrinibacteria bacterium CG10_big_fil_rev_8_21_14_0_10_44_7]PIX80609.1 MAG: hypothetical protein COZ35_00200 [Candidatus Peregrinibacteria bacterium CG_4_10_14_3_um_filter_44_21]PJB89610.1 MAG: hypothetical protein 